MDYNRIPQLPGDMSSESINLLKIIEFYICPPLKQTYCQIWVFSTKHVHMSHAGRMLSTSSFIICKMTIHLCKYQKRPSHWETILHSRQIWYISCCMLQIHTHSTLTKPATYNFLHYKLLHSIHLVQNLPFTIMVISSAFYEGPEITIRKHSLYT